MSTNILDEILGASGYQATTNTPTLTPPPSQNNIAQQFQFIPQNRVNTVQNVGMGEGGGRAPLLTFDLPDKGILSGLLSTLPRSGKVFRALAADEVPLLLSLLWEGATGTSNKRDAVTKLYEDYVRQREGVSDITTLPWWKMTSTYGALTGKPTFSDYVNSVLSEGGADKGLLYNMWNIAGSATEMLPQVTFFKNPLLLGLVSGVQEIPSQPGSGEEPNLIYDLPSSLTMALAHPVGQYIQSHVTSPIVKKVTQYALDEKKPSATVSPKFGKAGAPIAEMALPEVTDPAISKTLAKSVVSPTPNFVKTLAEQTLTQIPMGAYFGATGTLTDLVRGNIGSGEEAWEKFKDHTSHGIGVGIALHLFNRLPIIKPGAAISYDQVKKYFSEPINIYQQQKSLAGPEVKIGTSPQEYPVIGPSGEVLKTETPIEGESTGLKDSDRVTLEKLTVGVWNDISELSKTNPEAAKRTVENIRNNTPEGKDYFLRNLINQIGKQGGQIIGRDIVSVNQDTGEKNVNTYYKLGNTIFTSNEDIVQTDAGEAIVKYNSLDFAEQQSKSSHPVGAVLAKAGSLRTGESMAQTEQKVLDSLRLFNSIPQEQKQDAVNNLVGVAQEKNLGIYNEYGREIPQDQIINYNFARYAPSLETAEGKTKAGIVLSKTPPTKAGIEPSVGALYDKNIKATHAIYNSTASAVEGLLKQKIEQYSKDYDSADKTAYPNKEEYVRDKIQNDESIISDVSFLLLKAQKNLSEKDYSALEEAVKDVYNRASQSPEAFIRNASNKQQGTTSFLQELNKKREEIAAKKEEAKRTSLLTLESKLEPPPPTTEPTAGPTREDTVNNKISEALDPLLNELEPLMYKKSQQISKDIENVSDADSFIDFVEKHFEDKAGKIKKEVVNIREKLKKEFGDDQEAQDYINKNLLPLITERFREKANSLMTDEFNKIKYGKIGEAGLEQIPTKADAEIREMFAELFIPSKTEYIGGKGVKVFNPNFEVVKNDYKAIGDKIAQNVETAKQRILGNKDLTESQKESLINLINEMSKRANSGNAADIIWVSSLANSLANNTHFTKAMKVANESFNKNTQKMERFLAEQPRSAQTTQAQKTAEEPSAELSYAMGEEKPVVVTSPSPEIRQSVMNVNKIISTKYGWDDLLNRIQSGDVRVIKQNDDGTTIELKSFKNDEQLAKTIEAYEQADVLPAMFGGEKEGVLITLKKKISNKGVSLARARESKVEEKKPQKNLLIFKEKSEEPQKKEKGLLSKARRSKKKGK